MGALTEKDWQGAKWIGLDESGDEGIPTADIKSANCCGIPKAMLLTTRRLLRVTFAVRLPCRGS